MDPGPSRSWVQGNIQTIHFAFCRHAYSVFERLIYLPSPIRFRPLFGPGSGSHPQFWIAGVFRHSVLHPTGSRGRSIQVTLGPGAPHSPTKTIASLIVCRCKFFLLTGEAGLRTNCGRIFQQFFAQEPLDPPRAVRTCCSRRCRQQLMMRSPGEGDSVRHRLRLSGARGSDKTICHTRGSGSRVRWRGGTVRKGADPRSTVRSVPDGSADPKGDREGTAHQQGWFDPGFGAEPLTLTCSRIGNLRKKGVLQSREKECQQTTWFCRPHARFALAGVGNGTPHQILFPLICAFPQGNKTSF